MVQEWANKLAEAWLEVDHDMIHAMCELTDALSHVHTEGPMGLALVSGWVGSLGVWTGQVWGSRLLRGRVRSGLWRRGRGVVMRAVKIFWMSVTYSSLNDQALGFVA